MHKNDGKLIAVESYPFIGIAVAVALVALALQWMIVFWIWVVLTAFVVFFFRNPQRTPPTEAGVLASPADGKVIAIENVMDDRFLHDDVQRVTIFLSVFNVHMNWVPFTGVVKKVIYQSGKYLLAFHPKASLDNEQNAVVLETEVGPQIAFVQIAGLVARRIVCYLKEGDRVSRGDLMGLIRFGSRLDIYVPKSTEILVKVGDRVQGGQTPLARL
jgi:phosphatidylserine decarboxylase